MDPSFTYEDGKLYSEGKTCVPRRLVRYVLHAAHDVYICSHVGFTKTMGRVEKFHWRHKSRDIKSYVEGYQVCKQKKDERKKKLESPISLDVPTRRCGSLGTEFIVKLPKTQWGYDCIITWVDRLSRLVHFIPGDTTDTAVYTSNQFFSEVFRLHGLPDEIVFNRDPKFTS